MSKKYFGTDGIRGVFGKELSVELSLNIALAASVVFKKNNERPTICIARDPRESSKAIENALVAGFSSSGVNVVLFGITTTPVVSYMITHSENLYDAGIMISASHNPYHDNGIKFFGKDGKKLSDELEAQIEQQLVTDQEYDIARRLGEIETNKSAKEQYKKYLKSFSKPLTGLNIGLDTANGSSYQTGVEIFEELGANVTVIANNPDGVNINDKVGSTHPEKLSELVLKNNLDFGLAFDGDGDRVMLVNNQGEILDGDYMIYLITKYLKENNKLKGNKVVGTVMSNIGFKDALRELDVEYIESAVGDRFVMQAMTEHDAIIGGEQSGHIILADYLPTGDGILSGLLLANLFAEDMTELTNLTSHLKKYPQVLINLKVDDKNKVMNSEELSEIIKKQEQILGENGRILVRASGTENLVRVMSEAKTENECNLIIEPIIELINQL